MLDVLEACAKISASEFDEMGPCFMEMGEKKARFGNVRHEAHRKQRG